MGVAWVGRTSLVLTWRRAPQNGCTALYIAAGNGHDAVVQTLCREGADKSTPNKVGDGRGWDVERTNGVYFWLWVSSGLLTASVLARVVQPCNIEWTGIAQVDLRARSWAGDGFWSYFTNSKILN